MQIEPSRGARRHLRACETQRTAGPRREAVIALLPPDLTALADRALCLLIFMYMVRYHTAMAE